MRIKDIGEIELIKRLSGNFRLDHSVIKGSGDDTAVFLDPPYRSYERLYGTASPVADAVEQWARDNAHLRIALCGHRGDYSLTGWDAVEWSRGRLTYSGGNTTDSECVWYSPVCLPATLTQERLFA